MRKDGNGKFVVEPPEARFWAKVNKDGPVRPGLDGPCWEWVASRRNGYGAFRVGKKMWKANRFAWSLLRGEIPAGLCVLHRCDHPPCVNPDHLFLGTDADNARDTSSKGRSALGRPGAIARAKGEASSGSKLTEWNVSTIRAIRESGFGTLKEIGEMFGVRLSTVQRITERKTWRHVA